MNEVRISLQDSEREFLKQYLGSMRIKDTAESIDKLLSFENLYIGVTIIEMVTGKEMLPGTPNDIYQLIDWIRDFDFPAITLDIPGLDSLGNLLGDAFDGIADAVSNVGDSINPFD